MAVASKGQKPSRLSVSLSDSEYRDLQALAEKHDVSMAWLGRQAVLDFLDKHAKEEMQLPLKLPGGGSR